MVTLRLFNGSKTKEAWNRDSPEFVDDWKPEARDILADAVQVSYGQTVTVTIDDEQRLYFFDGDLLDVDGVYYGDFEILSDEDARPTPSPSVSPRAAAVIERFSSAAQKHGWEADQGSSESAADALRHFESARTELISLVSYLEGEAKRGADK